MASPTSVGCQDPPTAHRTPPTLHLAPWHTSGRPESSSCTPSVTTPASPRIPAGTCPTHRQQPGCRPARPAARSPRASSSWRIPGDDHSREPPRDKPGWGLSLIKAAGANCPGLGGFGDAWDFPGVGRCPCPGTQPGAGLARISPAAPPGSTASPAASPKNTQTSPSPIPRTPSPPCSKQFPSPQSPNSSCSSTAPTPHHPSALHTTPVHSIVPQYTPVPPTSLPCPPTHPILSKPPPSSLHSPLLTPQPLYAPQLPAPQPQTFPAHHRALFQLQHFISHHLTDNRQQGDMREQWRGGGGT